jgi:hypothetical protein
VFLTIFGTLFAVVAVIIDSNVSDKEQNIGKMQRKSLVKKLKNKKCLLARAR